MKALNLLTLLSLLLVVSSKAFPAVSPNIFADPGVELGNSNFVPIASGALSGETVAPISGARSMRLLAPNTGVNARASFAMTPYAGMFRADLSMIYKPTTTSNNALSVCLVAIHADGVTQNRSQCLTGKKTLSAKTLSFSLNVDAIKPVASLLIQLKNSGTTADSVNVLIDNLSLTINTEDATTPSARLDSLPSIATGLSTLDISPTSEQPNDSLDGTGNFRSVCNYSHALFDDPIIYSGVPGKSHLHIFFGNTGAKFSSTETSLKSSGNSTCRGGILNRSGYWVPALLDANGNVVRPVENLVYYKSAYQGLSPSAIQAFPFGLRAVSGNSLSSAPQDHTYWGCVNNYIGHVATIPVCPPGDMLEMHVEYPQCWNGTLDSPDHKSHLTFPIAENTCPATHPIAIPEISIHIRYDMPAGGTYGWHLVSDMYDYRTPVVGIYGTGTSGGMSSHADYMEGWDKVNGPDAFLPGCVQSGKDCHAHLLGNGMQMGDTPQD
ncbi:hypothetical protein [Caudoviricetes sp.]|nr:hypothetical protein [Caudoviricetes sp.]